MPDVFIDPAIVITPDDNVGKDGVVEWITNFTIWLHEALSSPFVWLHSIEATALLEAHGRFPSFETLRHLQRKYGLDINPAQIVKKVNEFFRDEERDLGGKLKMLAFDVEVENGSVVIQPSTFATRWSEFVLNHMRLLLATTCACKCIEHPLTRDLHIATLALSTSHKEIEVSAVIVAALPEFERGPDNKIIQRFPLLFTPDDLLPLIHVLELWNKGENGLIYAIEQQFKKDWRGTVSTPMKFRLGPHFRASVIEAGLDTNEDKLARIVRAASAVIADQVKHIKGYKLHERRESEAANSPQLVRSRDNAKAWRLMLEKHGAGWRLQYWQIPAAEGSIIEFSNVVKESDATIYD